MNRYPLTLRDKLRFKFGLLWASSLPSRQDIQRTAKALLYAALVLIAYATVSNHDYAEAMAHDNRALTTALATCINTTAPTTEEL